MKYDNGFKGEERRKSNGKVKFTMSNWITIILIAAGIGAGFVRAEMTIKNNSEKIEKVENNPTEIAVIKNDMGNMKESIGEIKREQTAMRTDMNNGFIKILEEIKNK